MACPSDRPGPAANSPPPTRSSIPPLAGRFLPDDSRGDLNVPQDAELPELLRRPRVLKDDLVYLERVDLTGLKAFDSQPDAMDQLAELLLVIGSDGLARCPTLGFGGHSSRLGATGGRRTRQLGRRGARRQAAAAAVRMSPRITCMTADAHALLAAERRERVQRLGLRDAGRSWLSRCRRPLPWRPTATRRDQPGARTFDRCGSASMWSPWLSGVKNPNQRAEAFEGSEWEMNSRLLKAKTLRWLLTGLVIASLAALGWTWGKQASTSRRSPSATRSATR